MRAETSIMGVKTSALELSTSLHTPGTTYIPKDSSPKELGQVIPVAKQQDHAAKFIDF
jgi:hypothetical protein